MSKLETPLTRWYWSQVGGTLVEEFLLTPRTPQSPSRLADGLIIPDAPQGIATRDQVEIDGKEVVVVQTKARRLGMYLMGQALFSQKLLFKTYSPGRIISVALCTKDDEELRPMLEAFKDVHVVVVPEDVVREIENVTSSV